MRRRTEAARLYKGLPVPRKYTRKQLKKPDEFITASMRAWQYAREQLPVVLTAAVAVAALVAGFWTWSHFADRRGMAATEIVSRALEIQHQMIIAGAKRQPPGEDGVPRFGSREEKLRAADEELSKLVKKGGRLGTKALALRAGVRYDAGRYREALEDYRKALPDVDPPLKARLQENIGYCHEALREWDKALEAFRKMPRDGDGKYLATYHEARILAKKGQTREAAKLFQEVISRGSPSLQERAGDQLALLEGK